MTQNYTGPSGNTSGELSGRLEPGESGGGGAQPECTRNPARAFNHNIELDHTTKSSSIAGSAPATPALVVAPPALSRAVLARPLFAVVRAARCAERLPRQPQADTPSRLVDLDDGHVDARPDLDAIRGAEPR